MHRIFEGKFRGRDVVYEPRCPFCGNVINRPVELPEISAKGMQVGDCPCGAVFCYDATGHNLGTAMSEALVYGCAGDWDKAWELIPDKDYLQERLENYDIETNLIIPGGIYEGRRIAGVLFFILIKDMRDASRLSSESVKENRMSGGTRHAHHTRGRRTYRKEELELLVSEFKTSEVLDLARSDHRVMRDLQRLLYSVDTLKRRRAAEILGKAVSLVAERDPDMAVTLLQGLFSSLTDTASSAWGSIAAIGEIIGSSPERYGRYVPQLLMFTGRRELLRDILDALRKIASAKPDLLRRYSVHFIPLLKDVSGAIRGITALLLGNLYAREAREDIEALLLDQAEVEIYRAGNLDKETVASLAQEALGLLC